MSTDRCRHDMLIGTCAECAGPPSRAAATDELVLIYDPDDPAGHRVHEPSCYWVTNPQEGVEHPWPREPITRREAAGMTPCGACQPSLPQGGKP